MKKVLAFGEIIWDIYPDRRVIGGAPLNFAGHCAAGGLESYLLSAVGKDGMGEAALQKLHEFGVKIDLVLQNDRKTGQCTVTLDAQGVPSYCVLPDVAYDHMEVGDIDRIRTAHFDAFYFGTLAQRCSKSRALLKRILVECRFGEIFCDLNLRDGCYDEDSIKNCLEHATVLKFSEEELPRLKVFPLWQTLCAQPFASLFHQYERLKVILFTKGEKGSAVYTREGAIYEIPVAKVKVVSTVGAGDSYGAAWLARYLVGDGERRAAEVASRVSGYVVSVVDALPRYRISDLI